MVAIQIKAYAVGKPTQQTITAYKGGGTTGATGALAPLKFSPPKIFSGQ